MAYSKKEIEELTNKTEHEAELKKDIKRFWQNEIRKFIEKKDMAYKKSEIEETFDKMPLTVSKEKAREILYYEIAVCGMPIYEKTLFSVDTMNQIQEYSFRELLKIAYELDDR